VYAAAICYSRDTATEQKENIMSTRPFVYDGILPLDQEAAEPFFGKETIFRLPVTVGQLIDFDGTEGFQDYMDHALGVILTEWKIVYQRTALDAGPDNGGLILYVTGIVENED
jgi:hypothetical protein